MKIHIDPKVLPDRFRAAREYLGLCVEPVAEIVGIRPDEIVAIENGDRKVGGLELALFMRLYRRPLEYFTGVDTQDPIDPDLCEAIKHLSPEDKEEIRQFVQFLSTAGTPR